MNNRYQQRNAPILSITGLSIQGANLVSSTQKPIKIIKQQDIFNKSLATFKDVKQKQEKELFEVKQIKEQEDNKPFSDPQVDLIQLINKQKNDSSTESENLKNKLKSLRKIRNSSQESQPLPYKLFMYSLIKKPIQVVENIDYKVLFFTSSLQVRETMDSQQKKFQKNEKNGLRPILLQHFLTLGGLNQQNIQTSTYYTKILVITVNHMEFHKNLSTKDNLIKNLKTYCQQKKTYLSQITPPTFIIDFNDESIDNNLLQFIKVISQFQLYYKHLQAKEKTETNPRKMFNEIRKNLKLYYQVEPLDSNLRAKQDVYCKPAMLKSQANVNLWILKPTSFNRGVGIHLFKTLQELEKLMIDYCKGIEEKVVPQKKDEKPEVKEPNQEKKEISKEMLKTHSYDDYKQAQKPKKKLTEIQKLFNSSNIPYSIKSSSFVIQKYIEEPLLIYKRKFDIRVWVLVNHKMDLFWFKYKTFYLINYREGYLRTSSQEFNLNSDQVHNNFIHLTNNAIQSKCQNYGEHEDGNQLSFQNFYEYMNQTKQEFQDLYIKPIKEQITLSMVSVKDKLNSENRQYCFEIFGYDFIIDQNNQVYLIEVNTNPCLEESSNLLKTIIPRMLDDAFKLTLDQLFPVKDKNVLYHVPQYDDKDNLWQLIQFREFLLNLQPRVPDSNKKNKNQHNKMK